MNTPSSGISPRWNGSWVLPYRMSGRVRRRPSDSAVAIHVYRVLQEALNNVARHSGTQQAWVRLRFAPDVLQLEVEDHGKGFGGTPPRRGLGLVAMRERAELVGGTLEFGRPNEGGTIVRLRVPLMTTSAASHGG